MLIYKTQIGQSSAYMGFALWLLTMPATAMPTVSQDFFATDNAAEKFFKVGRQQLESEIRLLNRQQLKDAETILQIDEQTQLNEEELENQEKLPLRRQHFKRQGTQD